MDNQQMQLKLNLLRRRNLALPTVRQLLHDISLLLAEQALDDLARKGCANNLVVVPILRAGISMLPAVLSLAPAAKIAFLGLERCPKTFAIREYYFKAPSITADTDLLILDPIIATGNTAVAATQRMQLLLPKSISFITILAATPGLLQLSAHAPDIPIYFASVDPNLNDKGYIEPGLGDAGDRFCG